MLTAYVLVLNKSWVAVNVASAKRALTLLFQGHARVVHPKDYALYDFDDWIEFSRDNDGIPAKRYVYTPASRIRLPEVIVLNSFNGFFSPEVRLSRRNIFARDKNICQYCGRRFSRTDLTIDHVIPKSRGSSDAGKPGAGMRFLQSQKAGSDPRRSRNAPDSQTRIAQMAASL